MPSLTSGSPTRAPPPPPPPRRHDAEVAGEADLEAPALRLAVDRGDAREGHVLEAVEHRVDPIEHRGELGVGGGEVIKELVDVGTGDEYLLAAGENQAVHALLLRHGVQRLAELVERGTVEDVDRSPFGIEAQLERVAVAGQAEGLALEEHGRAPG